MRVGRRQYTLGSLMVVIAAIAGLLAVLREAWSGLVVLALNCAALMILVLVGFGLGHFASKLASGVGEAFGISLPEDPPRPLEAERPPCPPT